MSFAFTPSYVFDGSSYDTAHENYSSGDDVYDTYGISKIDIGGSLTTVYFTSSTTMATWRNTDRSVQLEYTGSGSKGWEGTFDLTSDEEYTVNNSFNYLSYSTADIVGTSTLAELLADDIASNGTGSSILNINNLG